MPKLGWKPLLSSCTSWLFGKDASHDCEVKTKFVEDYRTGYPRFSALVAAHNSFQIFRRFSNIRARILLLKQDKLSMLEHQLEEIDATECAPLFLGSSRDDQNEQRSSILLEIDRALLDYDNFVERSCRMLSGETAKPRDVRSLQNWVNGNGCLSWDETEYLHHCRDLRSLVHLEDGAAAGFEAWIEDKLFWLLRKFNSTPCSGLSRDPHTFIASSPFIGRAARVLIVSLIIMLISLPIIICRSVSSSLGRVVVVILSLMTLLFLLSGYVRKTHELFIAGATYATILVVFVSSNNINAN